MGRSSRMSGSQHEDEDQQNLMLYQPKASKKMQSYMLFIHEGSKKLRQKQVVVFEPQPSDSKAPVAAPGRTLFDISSQNIDTPPPPKKIALPTICVTLVSPADDEFNAECPRIPNFALLQALDSALDTSLEECIETPEHHHGVIIHSSSREVASSKNTLQVPPTKGVPTRVSTTRIQGEKLAENFELMAKKPNALHNSGQCTFKGSGESTAVNAPKKVVGGEASTANVRRMLGKGLTPKMGRVGTLKNLMAFTIERPTGQMLEPPKRKRRILPSQEVPVVLPDPGKMLWRALRQIRVYEAESILQDYANVRLDMKNEDGDTMMHVAVRSGSVALVEMLVRAGAELNAQDVCADDHPILTIGFRKLSAALRAKLRIQQNPRRASGLRRL